MFSLNAHDTEEFLATSSANIRLCQLEDSKRHGDCEPDQEIVNMLPSLHFSSTTTFTSLISQPSSRAKALCHTGRGVEIEISMLSEYGKYKETCFLQSKNCTQFAVKKSWKVCKHHLQKDHLGTFLLALDDLASLGDKKKKICLSITFIKDYRSINSLSQSTIQMAADQFKILRINKELHLHLNFSAV